MAANKNLLYCFVILLSSQSFGWNFFEEDLFLNMPVSIAGELVEDSTLNDGRDETCENIEPKRAEIDIFFDTKNLVSVFEFRVRGAAEGNGLIELFLASNRTAWMSFYKKNTISQKLIDIKRKLKIPARYFAIRSTNSSFLNLCTVSLVKPPSKTLRFVLFIALLFVFTFCLLAEVFCGIRNRISDRIEISLTQISKEIDRLLAFDMKEKGQTLVQEGEKYKKSHKGEAKKNRMNKNSIRSQKDYEKPKKSRKNDSNKERIKIGYSLETKDENSNKSQKMI